MSFQLRPYQSELAQKGCEILKELGIVYYNCEVRVGKTLMALQCANLYGAKRVLFLTKLKAIASIKGDFEKLNPDYELVVINDESMHKVEGEFDLIIHDEHHRFGGFPRPGKHPQMFRERFFNHPQIWLSGTMSPESWSQIFHQFWVSSKSPFKHKNFYAFAREFVDIRQRKLPQGLVNDYSHGLQDKILPVIEPFALRMTQSEAGFQATAHEHFCYVEMPPICGTIANRLMSTGVVQGKKNIISADNAAALNMKVRQIMSGSIILDAEDGQKTGTSVTLSTAKADYIQQQWPDKKLVIFYVFKHELSIIQQVLQNRVTTDVSTFQQSGNRQSIALQIVAGREGLRLSDGDLIVFFNIAHSATSYFQGIARLLTSDRLESHVYWLFSSHDGEPGIEKSIYEVVQKKKPFTTNHFKKLYKSKLHPKFNARI